MKIELEKITINEDSTIREAMKAISLPSSPDMSLKEISKVSGIILRMVNNSCKV
jgi:hypothetical protein